MKIQNFETNFAILGSGAGGASIAYELAKRGKKVIILEKGLITGRIGTETAATKFYDKYGLLKSKEGIIIYRTLMAGGTTVASCGNGVRSLEEELLKLNIDIRSELDETEKELGVIPFDLNLMGDGTKKIWEASKQLGFEFEPMPKFIDFSKCISCGNCVLGCLPQAKWTALKYIERAQEFGTKLITNFKLESISISNDKATGIVGNVGNDSIHVTADKTILSAGAIESPRILQKAGLDVGNSLFCDLFTVLYGITENTGLSKEPTMAIVNHSFYKSDGFILSPFLDSPLTLTMIHPKYLILAAKRDRVLGIMVKIKDDSSGKIELRSISKKITENDKLKLEKGNEIAKKILLKAGVNPKSLTLIKPRGAHPGGTIPIGKDVDKYHETKIKNLLVNDASILPESPGLPPILTIIAMSKRLAKNLC
jgi:choline dehydrogenase-like flavoprotein